LAHVAASRFEDDWGDTHGARARFGRAGATHDLHLLNASGDIAGGFASANSLYPFLLPSLSSDADNVHLTLLVGGFAAPAAPCQHTHGSSPAGERRRRAYELVARIFECQHPDEFLTGKD
jgi:hypothetical protein